MNPNYKRAMEHISISPEAAARIEARMARPRRLRITPRRWVALAAVAVLVCALAVTANADMIYNFFHPIDPELAAQMEPVGRTCSNHGLTLTVQSATMQDGKLFVYAFIQNDGDSGILSANVYTFTGVNIIPRYFLRGAVQQCTVESLGYDEDSGAFGFLFTLEEKGEGSENEKTLASSGNSFIFTMDNMILDKTFSHVRLAPDWHALPGEPEFMTVEGRVQTLEPTPDEPGLYGRTIVETQTKNVLQPGTFSLPVMESYTVSAMGFLEDGLHIQLRHEKNELRDIITLRLSRSDDETLSNLNGAGYGISFDGDEDGVEYEEYVFDISPSELDGQEIRFGGYHGGKLVEGKWTVTFGLDGEEYVFGPDNEE